MNEVYDFKNDVLLLANEFYGEYGKWPNELHLGGGWHDDYDDIVNKSDDFHKADPFGKIKHWWYMGMRVFNEHWTHAVEWTESTEIIKKELGLM